MSHSYYYYYYYSITITITITITLLPLLGVLRWIWRCGVQQATCSFVSVGPRRSTMETAINGNVRDQNGRVPGGLEKRSTKDWCAIVRHEALARDCCASRHRLETTHARSPMFTQRPLAGLWLVTIVSIWVEFHRDSVRSQERVNSQNERHVCPLLYYYYSYCYSYNSYTAIPIIVIAVIAVYRDNYNRGKDIIRVIMIGIIEL